MDIKAQFLILILIIGCVLPLIHFSPKLALKSVINSEANFQLNSLDIWRYSVAVLLLFVASAIAIDIGIQRLIGYDYEHTSLYFSKFLAGIAGQDSWGVMVKALIHFENAPSDSVYQALILKDNTKFQYPPSALLIFDIPQRLFGFSYDALVKGANIVSWICIPLLTIIFYCLLKNSALIPFGDVTVKSYSSKTYLLVGVTALVASVAVVMMFYPLLRSYFLGQIQTFMTLLVAFSLLAWQKKRYGVAGMLLSLCCSLKPQWIILVPWAFFRKQWEFLIAFFTSLSVIVLLTIAFYGIKNWLDYFSVISMLSRHGESFYPNQSINGVLHRLFLNGNNLEWLGNAFPPYHVWVHVITVATSMLMLVFALFWKRKHQPSNIDLSIIILTLTIASPIAWEHHFAICLLLLAIILPLTLKYQPMGKWSVLYMWATYLLVSQNYGYLASPLAETYYNFLQSTLYFGVLMLLYYLYKLSQKQHQLFTLKNL